MTYGYSEHIFSSEHESAEHEFESRVASLASFLTHPRLLLPFRQIFVSHNVA